MLIVAGLFATQLPKLKIDASTEAFLHEDDPTLKTYYAFLDEFGRDEMIVMVSHSSSMLR